MTNEAPTSTTPTISGGADAALASFLRRHSLASAKVRAVFEELQIGTLYDLRTLVQKPLARGTAEEMLMEYPVAVMSLNALTVEQIDNAIFLAENPEAEPKVTALKEFLTDHDVLVDAAQWDSLFAILRDSRVTSLDALRAVKEGGAEDSKGKSLRTKITKWNADAGSAFAAIMAGDVASARRGPTAVEPELKAFLAKKRIPAAAEQELADLGITSLEQLRGVVDDKSPGGAYERLRQKLANSGIQGAAGQLDRLRTSDVEREIAETGTSSSATTAKPPAKTADLDKVIRDVEALRVKLAAASAAQSAAVTSEVEAQHRAVLAGLKDVSLSDMERVTAAATRDRADLDRMLRETIANASAARRSLDAVDQTPLPMAVIMRRRSMLSGFLMSPQGCVQTLPPLIKLPDEADDLMRAEGTERTFRRNYTGNQTDSFAVASAQQTSSSLATTAEASGGAFVGSGVAAVSAAGSYADGKRASREDEQFESTTRAECGEVDYTYAPRASVVFDRSEVRLSEAAAQKLQTIAATDPRTHESASKEFLIQYGSHIFLHQELGGRYQLTARGASHTAEGKGLLMSAVARTMQWAASASGSYAGVGGAASAAASIQGQTSVAEAKGNRYGLNFAGATVTVTTESVGGAPGTNPRDLWERSLDFNSTWAVIDRKEPMAVWEVVRADPTLAPAVAALAPLLEKVWVREIVRPAVKKIYPALYHYLDKQPDITTAAKLTDAVEAQSAEPALEITVISATSRSAEHPWVIAGSDRPGLKLIGGGASVDYGGGPGLLLTGSYPEGNAWAASAKSHLRSSPGTVTAYAVYLNDPFDLWEVYFATHENNQPSNRPTATAELPLGYTITGGGARIKSSGVGVMLTSCCPQGAGNDYRRWIAAGKDHVEGDGSGTATAWVFGIRPRNGVQPTASKVSPHPDQGSLPTVQHKSDSDQTVIVGGGASVTWRGPGGMLTWTGPTGAAWKAQAKAHLDADGTLDLTMWKITRPGSRVDLDH